MSAVRERTGKHVGLRDEGKLDPGPLLEFVARNLEQLPSETEAGCEAQWRMIRRAREAGFIRFGSADQLCCWMNVHPAEIWGWGVYESVCVSGRS